MMPVRFYPKLKVKLKRHVFNFIKKIPREFNNKAYLNSTYQKQRLQSEEETKWKLKHKHKHNQPHVDTFSQIE